jgi:hypothetical protein
MKGIKHNLNVARRYMVPNMSSCTKLDRPGLPWSYPAGQADLSHYWYFLASLLGFVFPSNGTRSVVTIFLNTCRNILQAHGYIVVAFLRKYSGIVHLYFPKGRHGVKASNKDMDKITWLHS